MSCMYVCMYAKVLPAIEGTRGTYEYILKTHEGCTILTPISSMPIQLYFVSTTLTFEVDY